MKYRIIKKEVHGEIWFEVQHKFLFWWFTDVTNYYGIEFDLTFNTEEEAKKYICLQKQQSKSTIVYETN